MRLINITILPLICIAMNVASQCYIKRYYLFSCLTSFCSWLLNTEPSKCNVCKIVCKRAQSNFSPNLINKLSALNLDVDNVSQASHYFNAHKPIS